MVQPGQAGTATQLQLHLTCFDCVMHHKLPFILYTTAVTKHERAMWPHCRAQQNTQLMGVRRGWSTQEPIVGTVQGPKQTGHHQSNVPAGQHKICDTSFRGI
jgi:hypothetical protein